MQNIDKLVDGALARGDGQSGAIAGLERQLGAGPVADALWAAVRRRDARVVEDESLSSYLAKGTAFDGRDAAAYIELLASVWGPKGERRFSWGSRLAWSDDSPAGLSTGVRAVAGLVAPDRDRLAEFLTRAPGFEAPWRQGVALALRGARAAGAPEIDDAYLEDLAARWTRNHWASDWSNEFALDEGRWRAALTRALSHTRHGDLNPRGLLAVARWAPPAAFFEALDRTGYENADHPSAFEAVALVRAREPKLFDARFEEIFSRSTLQKARVGEARYSVWPALYALFGALASRRATGEGAPDEAFDVAISSALDGFRVPWSGGRVEDYLDELIELLALVPVARRERIFALQSDPNPALLASVPAAKALRRAAKAVAAHEPKPGFSTPQQHVHAARVLAKSTAGIEAMVAELRESAGPSRAMLVRELATSDSSEAAEGLTVALGDASKGVRETAREALINTQWKNPGEVFALLDAAVRSRSKDARLDAARVLLAWPDAQAAADRARAALRSEKIAGVVALLKQTAARAAEKDGTLSAGESAAPAKAKARAKAKGEKAPAAPAPEGANTVAPEDPALAAAVAVVRAMLETDGHPMNAWSFDDWVARELPASYAARALAGAITAGAYERIEQVGRKPHIEVEHLLAWLVRNDPAAGLEAFAQNVSHKRVRPAEASVDGLARVGPAGAARAASMLAAASDKVRATLATVLRRSATGAELAAIEACVKLDPRSKALGALESARAAAAAATLDVGIYPPTLAGDAELDAALAGLPKGASGPTKTPLRTRAGHALSDAARAWFAGQLSLEDVDRAGAPVRAVRARLRDDDCAALCDELLAGLPPATADYGPCLFLRAVIAGPAQVDRLAARLEAYATEQQGDWGGHAVDVLVRIGTHQAVRALDRAQRTTKRASLRTRARWGLERLAHTRGTDVDALLDAALERFGFDAAGTRALPYAGGTLTLTLGADNALSYALGTKPASGTAPAPRKGNADDAAVKRELTHLAKELKRSTKLQRALWERAMAVESRWSGTAFTERFREHPLARGPARGLVFLCTRGEGAAAEVTAFVLDDARAPVDLAGRAVALRGDDSVTIAHPARTRPEDLAAAEALFAREGRTQPFAQLARKHFAADVAGATRDARVQSALPSDGLGYMVTRLNRLGYEPGSRQDAGLVCDSSRAIGPYRIALQHDGYIPGNPEELLGAPHCAIDSVRVYRGAKHVAFGELPATVFSEVLRDLWLLGGGNEGTGEGPSDDAGDDDDA